MLAISLFDYTGNMLKPWLKAGYECHVIDVQHTSSSTGDGITAHNIDLLTRPQELWMRFAGQDIAFVSAFPPCTHLAVSGARWFRGKGLSALAESISLFSVAADFCESTGAAYLIENPVSTISTYWRKPDHTFHPCDFTNFEVGDNYTKKTCLWTGGGFVMPSASKADLGDPDNRIHSCPPSPERSSFRSATPMGFARAVFESNAQRQGKCTNQQTDD